MATVEFLPEAALEVEEAVLWYSRRGPELAPAFVNELDNALSAITERPLAWTQLQHGARRYVMPVFPYSVVFVIRGEIILVVAVAHGKRRPYYWRHRVPPRD